MDVGSFGFIEAKGVVKRFGDFIAIDHVDFTLRKSETVGIIGPNGAGKTTFLNLITGLYIPDRGVVKYEGIDITRYSPETRVSIGMLRTFQLVRIFDNLSVYDNLALSYFRKKYGRSLPLNIFFNNLVRLEIQQRVYQTSQLFELDSMVKEKAGNLPLGSKRRLEIAMVLIADPKMLALDEPFAGLSDKEIDELLDVLKDYNHKITILIIEHKVSKLLSFVDRLAVMHEGKIVASGLPEETLDDPEVRRVYWKLK
jgi:branched-chain amino acid transport system ATP-binding protein